MEGYGDLSSFANWIYKYIDGDEILKRIEKISNNKSRYENILFDLCSLTCTEEKLEKLAQEPKEGSVYECNGPFSMSKEDEWDEWDESVETAKLNEGLQNANDFPELTKSVKEWYVETYPKDEFAAEMTEYVTFADIATVPQKIYDLLGVYDSLIRERVFNEISERCGVAYDDL